MLHNGFCANWNGTVVAMPTQISHRLIIGKKELKICFSDTTRLTAYILSR